MVLFGVWGHPAILSGFLTLHIVITPGSIWVTIWDNRDGTPVSFVQGRYSIWCAITLDLRRDD